MVVAVPGSCGVGSPAWGLGSALLEEGLARDFPDGGTEAKVSPASKRSS